MERNKITLKEAIEQNKLEEFIKERENLKVDKETLDKLIESVVNKPSGD